MSGAVAVRKEVLESSEEDSLLHFSSSPDDFARYQAGIHYLLNRSIFTSVQFHFHTSGEPSLRDACRCA